MIFGVHLEVLLALTYALFLAGIALIFEFLARRSHKRVENYRTAGFIYFGELDYWECPAGHQLVQLSIDHQRKITHYRAPASACNSCSLKSNCTDSNEGRVLEKRLDTWIESELRRFHRGLSLALLVLAIALLLAETFRYTYPHDREALVGFLFPYGFALLKLLPSLGPRLGSTYSQQSF